MSRKTVPQPIFGEILDFSEVFHSQKQQQPATAGSLGISQGRQYQFFVKVGFASFTGMVAGKVWSVSEQFVLGHAQTGVHFREELASLGQ